MVRYGTVRTSRDTVYTRRSKELRCVTIGDPSEQGKAPIFFLHPINLRKECWLGLLPALAADRQCITVDLTGHGESSDDDQFSLERWVADCLDVVTSLRLDRFHVVGGSLGGAIALCVAGELPDNVLSVTTMGSSLGEEPEPAGEHSGDAHPDLAQVLDTTTVEDLFARLAVEAVAPHSPASLVRTVRDLTNSHGRQVVRRVLQAAQLADATQWTHHVRCPVLVLSGEFDTTCTAKAGIRMAMSVDGRHELLPGVGHLPMLEDPPAVLRTLLPHLANAESESVAPPAPDPARLGPALGT